MTICAKCGKEINKTAVNAGALGDQNVGVTAPVESATVDVLLTTLRLPIGKKFCPQMTQISISRPSGFAGKDTVGMMVFSMECSHQCGKYNECHGIKGDADATL